MEERLNERGAGRHVQIRAIVIRKDGEVRYGLTVNREIAVQFSGISLYPRIERNSIIFESGARIQEGIPCHEY